MIDWTSKYRDKIMPCPTCRVEASLQEGGSAAAPEYKYRAGCEKCRDFEYGPTPEAALALWNGHEGYSRKPWEERFLSAIIQLGYDIEPNKIKNLIAVVEDSPFEDIATRCGAKDKGDSLKYDVAIKLAEYMARNRQ